MIIPTKGITPQRALLTVGAQILLATEHRPVTVSQAWRRFQEWRKEHQHNAPIPFWWFALGLDVLYALGVVEFSNDILIFRERPDAA